MAKMYKFGTLLILFLCMASSCNNLLEQSSTPKNLEEGMKVIEVFFSPDYKKFYVNVKIADNVGPYSLSDTSSIRIETKELDDNFSEYNDDYQPLLADVRNIRAQELAEQNLHLLVLVDLTLSQELIDAQCDAIKQMKTWFINDNLYVAFLKNGTVSESMPVSDYVIQNYFKRTPSEKYLYRSILCKMDELEGTTSKCFPNVQQDSIWKSLTPMEKALVTFSDGNIYEGNHPIDPDHYELQEELIQRGDSLLSPSVYYINFESHYKEGEGNEIQQIIKLFCERTDGIYMNTFDWNILLPDLLETFNVEYSDFQFSFVNPDNKIYRGEKHYMQIKCFHNDKLLATTYATYALGSVYNPIIVNGKSTTQIILHGCLLSVVLAILVYLIFQFIIPYIRYFLFKRKYIIRYTNNNMSYNGRLIDQSCYFCKAPFEEGDEIVVKCSHTLHKSCWDENGYKCPEYGRNCKDGSHFYNKRNLLDLRNASFYMKWVITGILAGLAGWIYFVAFVYRDTGNLLIEILLRIHELEPGTPEAAAVIDAYGSHLFYMPFYGLSISFFLTLLLCFLSEHNRKLNYLVIEPFIKAIIGGACGYFFFLIGCIISILLDLQDNTLIIDWIPWSLSGFMIALIVTVRTEIKLRKSLILMSILLGLGSMYLWLYAFSVNINSREQLLLSYIIYSMGMAVSIATVSPRSERYFLRVIGPIKEMDIALYKWMKSSPDYRVSIGKSINCNLQMSWDIDSNIAPIQAEIRIERGHLYLVGIEEGIYLSSERSLAPDAKIRLYHGQKFKIGKTTFVYIEKDVRRM